VRRICLDSNVLVAAFVSRGLCADILRLVLSEYDLVIPEVVFDEVRRVLLGKLRFSKQAFLAVEAVLSRCEIVPRGSHPSPVSVRDPDDERVLADALSAGVQMLITGDGDLLAVAGESPIPILSPRAFLTLARGHVLTASA
jgi:putative PIN family toxin of toxin-antitoxin system